MATITNPVPNQNPLTVTPASQPPTGTTGTTSTQPTSAADLLRQTLTEWGLTSLLPYVQDYLTKGYDSTTINLYLQDTPEWKQRFAGNELRKQKGLPVLSPATYIATEEQYRNVLQSYGLPSGFYDQHSDFTDFIGNDISPTEISQRAKVAYDQYLNAPPEQRDLWNQYFGPGDAIAGILDPEKATQVIVDRGAQVAIGGAALAQGINVSGSRAAYLQQHQVTLAQAQQAYSQIAQYGQADQNIGNRFGDSNYATQDNEENRLLLNNGALQDRANVLNNSERGLFRETAGADRNALGVSQELAATEF